MAKSTARKTSNAPKQTGLTAIAACFEVIYGALTDAAKQSAENKERGASRSSQCVAAIGALRDSITDKAEFHVACVGLFGNGERKKGVRVAGTLSDRLSKEGVKDVSVYSLLSQCRVLAAHWDNAAVRKAAIEGGVRAGYDATKPPKEAPSNNAPKEAPKSKEPSLAEMIASMVRDGGTGTILGMVESALIASKDTIRAKIVHDVRTKIAA